MIYSNPEFLFLFLPTLLFYCLVRSHTVRSWIILISSFAFYAWAGFVDTAIFACFILISWTALYLAKTFPLQRKRFLAGGICLMAFHLFFWKYASWISGQIQILWPNFLHGRKVQLPLPVGISFFTLQGIAYLVDYGLGEAGFMNLREYTFFKSFFPQLVAGPIVRASVLLPQLKRLPTPTSEDFAQGLALFVMGFFKKVVVADRVSKYVDAAFHSPHDYGTHALILGLCGYAVQIWADFSGYTDMGRGVARMLGIRLPENFLSPYLSLTPSEFWKRWHITLSEWIRDYLYIPISRFFGRDRNFKVYASLVLTMAISGLWHGANWTFVLWGVYHGALLVAERQLRGSFVGRAFSKVPESFCTAILFVVMTVATLFGWLIFRASSLVDIANFLHALMMNRLSAVQPGSPNAIYLALFVCASHHVLHYRPVRVKNAIPVWQHLAARIENRFSPVLQGIFAGMAMATGLLLSLFFGAGTVVKSFIYFQF